MAPPVPCECVVIFGRPGSGKSSLAERLGAESGYRLIRTGEMLRAAGADWRHVARMNFFLPSLDQRSALNGPWVEHFPDPASRPARHTEVVHGPAAKCDFVAYVTD